jgi:sugar phosphate isomerase/epimerase
MCLPQKRAYHVVYDKTLDDSLRYAQNNNWTAIVPDISVPRFSPHLFSTDERTSLQQLSESLGIEWGFHAPGDNISLRSTYPPVRKGILSYYKSIIDFAKDVSTKPTNLVVHAGETPHFREAKRAEDEFVAHHYDIYKDTLSEMFSALIEYGRPSVDIVIENYKWDTMIHEVIQELVPKGLKLCMDIPKLYNPNLTLCTADWVLFEEFSDAIEVIHIHDWIPNLGSHQTIGEGSIDFNQALSFLGTIPRSLQYVIEVRPREYALASLENLESILDVLGIKLR